MNVNQVFISHSHQDVEFIGQLVKRLEEKEINYWIDSQGLEVGHSWRQGIDTAIKRSSAMIIVLSKTSVKSPYVTYEWAYAYGLNIPLIPIIIENNAKEDLHPRLEDIQYIDFVSNTQQTWEKLYEEVERKLVAYSNNDSKEETDALMNTMLDENEDIHERLLAIRIVETRKLKTAIPALRICSRENTIPHILRDSAIAALTTMSVEEAFEEIEYVFRTSEDEETLRICNRYFKSIGRYPIDNIPF